MPLKIVKRTLAGQALRLAELGKKKREFTSMTEMLDFFREAGRRGGKIGGRRAAEGMSKAERIARAKKAAAASAKVRSAKARARKAK